MKYENEQVTGFVEVLGCKYIKTPMRYCTVYSKLTLVCSKPSFVYSKRKIEDTAVESTNFKEGQKINVWFTDDDNHLPILVEAKVVVGSVKGYLDSYEGLKSPLTLKITAK